MSSLPVVRSNICLNTHPVGCAAFVRRQIDQVRHHAPIPGNTPRTALIIGASTGYGLASRIEAGFACGSDTIGVSFERAPDGHKSGTPGWYNNRAFERAAAEARLRAVTIEADAFADETKKQVVEALRAWGRKVDLIVYSLASPVRVDPVDGVSYRSAIKPIGAPYSGTTVDAVTARLSQVTVEPATPEETFATVKVMGGEDWQRWMDQLAAAGLLGRGVITVAFSYIGPALTQAIYRSGTLGAAKANLEATAHTLTRSLAPVAGRAFVSVNKALVTRASAVIPAMPLYIAALYRAMKDRKLHEGCIEQIERLFRERLYTEADVPVDEEGRIRIDDWEMRADVQATVDELMAAVRPDNVADLVDIEGYRHDFFELHGFHAPKPVPEA